jgi:subtilisin family serine protease
MASFSSRGPTRSFWTDVYGVKHYDNVISPTLSHPATKSFPPSLTNALTVENPLLDTGCSTYYGTTKGKLMTLSGTSVSTPVVAGAAALILQLRPDETPNGIKSLLMYTAQPLAGFNMFEQGTGQLNIEGAVRVINLIRPDVLLGILGYPMLTSNPTPQSMIAGHISLGAGVILSHNFVYGSDLINKYQAIYAPGAAMDDAVMLTECSSIIPG